MSKSEPLGQGGRLVTASFLVVALVGLVLWYGSSKPALFETVTGSRPTVLTPVLEQVFPLTDRPPTRKPWEGTYMYYISFVASIWVAVRFVQGWQFDREQLAFVPRTRHRSLNPWTRSGRSSERDREHESEHGRNGGRHGGVRDA